MPGPFRRGGIDDDTNGPGEEVWSDLIDDHATELLFRSNIAEPLGDQIPI